MTGWENNKLVLIWPLMLDGKRLRMLSSDTLEYRDIILSKDVDQSNILSLAWAYIKKNSCANLYLFQSLPENSRLISFLHQNHLTPPVQLSWSPIIRLNNYPDWNVYELQLPKSLRSDQRRQWRRSREIFPELSFKIVSDLDEIEKTVDWLMLHKVKWLDKNNKSSDYFGSNEMLSFIKESTKSAQASGNLVMAQLSSGNTILSAGYGYKFDNKFLFHMFTYDQQWQRLSPSRLFLEKLIRWCFTHNIEVFDFMPDEEAYKITWATTIINFSSYAGAFTQWGKFIYWWQFKKRYRATSHILFSNISRLIPKKLRKKIRNIILKLGLEHIEMKDISKPIALSEKKPL